MPYFERASEFDINGSQFTDIEISGNVYVGQHNDPDQDLAVHRLLEKDASLNQYSAGDGTVTIPRFSKELLLRDLPQCPDVGRIGSGSCAFDLLIRLGLFPGQPNEHLGEYDTSIPVGSVVSRGNCYCGRISRHGLIYLVSKYFQDASVAEVSGGGTCIVISTTIGRFKCYEIMDHIFVHFDIGTRTSQVELIREQNLEDLLMVAQGKYMTEIMVDRVPTIKWVNDSAKSLEYMSTVSFFGVPKTLIYMTKDTLDRWTRLRDFAYALVDTVLLMVEALAEPESFVSALQNVSITPQYLGDVANYSTPAKQLAICYGLTRSLSQKKVSEMTFEDFSTYVSTNLTDLCKAHQHYRSNKVEISKLYSTSQDRFLLMLRQFPSSSASHTYIHSHPTIQNELKKLLYPNKSNNVSLVVYQGFLGMFALWNSSRVLKRAREAPQEWIRFLAADEDMIYLG